MCREREREIVCCESGTKIFVVVSIDLDCVRREGVHQAGDPILKKEIKQYLLVDLLLVCCGDIFVCRGRRKDSLDFDGTGAFLWHPFCVKRAGRGQAGNGGDPGFDDYGWTVLFFSSLRF